MEKILKNFACKDKDATAEKLEKFIAAGKDKTYLISDFDRTITPLFNEKGEEVSTWGLMSRRMPAAIRAREVKLYEKYRPLEVAGKMTVEDAVDWWSTNLDLYEISRTKWSDLADEVEEAMPARPGATALFDLCAKKGIPAIILSAGIKDVIELWCNKFEVRPGMILSTKLCFDAKGFVCGWEKSSLVHTLNKLETGKKHLGDIQKARPHAILIGDSMDDAAMVEGADNVLRLFIDNKPADTKKGGDFYAKVFEKFDFTVQNDSLQPLVDAIKLI